MDRKSMKNLEQNLLNTRAMVDRVIGNRDEYECTHMMFNVLMDVWENLTDAIAEIKRATGDTET